MAKWENRFICSCGKHTPPPTYGLCTRCGSRRFRLVRMRFRFVGKWWNPLTWWSDWVWVTHPDDQER